MNACDWLQSRMDWDDLRFLLTVARRGTLTAAAGELGVTQPTVGRRIVALERSLGARLFERRPSGLTPSRVGARLVEHAERMEREAIAAERHARGRDEGVRGTVVVTASEWLVTGVLAPMLGPLLERHTALCVELLADTRHLNLARAEADIALRPRRFEHDAVAQRATGKLGFGLYATPAYLDARGMPGADQGAGHRLIAMRDDVGDVARKWLATTLAHANIVAKTNGRDAMLSLARSGVGMAVLARVVGDACPHLVRLPPAVTPVPTLWMGVHRETRGAPRVAAVSRYLADRLRKLQPKLNPQR